MAADNSAMPLPKKLSNNPFISHALQMHLQTLEESVRTGALARDDEVDLRVQVIESVDHTMPRPKAPSTTTDQDRDAVADLASDAITKAIGSLLSNLRELLGMDIALVAEFLDGQRIFRHVDVDQRQSSRLKVGDSVPLESTYCQRVIDGRLPAMIPDTAALPETHGLAATQGLGIGAYLSTPVVLSNGEVYGTLCCISHQARSALGCRQTDALRSVAALVSAEIEKNRRR